MFIEVNELKGLVINLKSFEDNCIGEWKPVNNHIPCVFIVRDEKQHELLLSSVDRACNVLEVHSHFPSGQRHVKQALAMMGLQPYEAAYVTASERELLFMLNEPLGSILINSTHYAEIGRMPDFKLNEISEINAIIENPSKGYLSEVVSTNLSKEWKSINPFSRSGYFITNTCQCDDKEYLLLSGGRYYGPKHALHPLHQLSCRILKSKYNNNQSGLFYRIFAPLVRYINNKVEAVDGVTRVPPKPQKQDRFATIVANICATEPYEDWCSAMRCIHEHRPQKSCINKQARADNVAGKYLAMNAVNGCHVVIIDDIFTTGATMTECVRMLYEAGARRVTAVVLGINQFELIWRSSNRLKCSVPKCQGDMALRFFGDDVNVFWGCTNYQKNKCPGMNFLDGVHAINKLNQWDLTEDDAEDEIEF